MNPMIIVIKPTVTAPSSLAFIATSPYQISDFLTKVARRRRARGSTAGAGLSFWIHSLYAYNEGTVKVTRYGFVFLEYGYNCTIASPGRLTP
jgi:hypothetical protein